MYDIIVVGGGIYGCCALFEAARHGLNCLLLEADDFAAGVTANNFRTLHGGLRSLQTLDFLRFSECVSARNWFFRYFPSLTRTRRFLMPLNGTGLYRPSIMQAAGLLNDVLSMQRNAGVDKVHQIPRTRLFSPAQAGALLSEIGIDCRAGAFGWVDGNIGDCHRVVIELLRWATGWGTQAVNYHRVANIHRGATDHHYTVDAQDSTTARSYELRSKVIVDATGCQSTPWDDLLTDGKRHYPSLAWNVLVARSTPSQDAVAVVAQPSATYFAKSFRNQLHLGTGHMPLGRETLDHESAESLVATQLPQFLAKINAVTQLDLNLSEVCHVQRGILPVETAGSMKLAVRANTRRDSAGGLYQVSGVKFTTAREVVARLINDVVKQHFTPNHRVARTLSPSVAVSQRVDQWNAQAQSDVLRIIREEAVVYPADLIERRLALPVGDTVLRQNITDFFQLHV